MKPQWDQLGDAFADSKSVIIVDVDCTQDKNKDLCQKFGVRGYPTIKYFSGSTGPLGDDYQGGQLFRGIDREKMTADFVAAARWLKARPDCSGRIASTGFCFGGGMSNTLAVLLGADLAAAAPFYGGGPAAADVPKIRAAMLIHHGALDTRLVDAYPGYEAAMQANQVTHEGHIYPDSVHGFFNDATPERYNQTTAEEAWTRTIAWFNQHTREAV